MVKSVALLMPALNEETSAVETLDSIFKSTRLPDEIIVADGGSTDKTREVVAKYQDRGVKLIIIDNPDVYAGAGRNYAFAACNSDILMLMDFGNTVAPDWIEKMAVPFEQNPEMGFVSGAFIPDADSDFEHVVASILYHNNALLDKIPIEKLMQQMPTDHSPGALSLAISRDMWIKVQGMPDWLRAAEDKLFGRKMMTFKPVYALLPEARIKHHMRSNLLDVFKQMQTYSRGNGRTRYLQKYLLKLLAIYILPLIFIPFFPTKILLTAIVIGALMYFWKSGVSKVIKVDGKLRKHKFIFQSIGIVVARDLGVMWGTLLGLFDWHMKPQFKQKYYQYIKDTSLINEPIIVD
ncbi:glycosyltransferase [Aliiglaciecola lipolytica]|uniref:Glycosyltransferase 2-like domain-containing protein n=1 Tax=Aliiglaciecola lipolytica E3 TaxID=1127673 RepID=K6Y645_9ALTE|nr:glycosyltransferase [Aliiglaciecola lipolytica]GAC13702.1 hypothetical protein GLIP_1060 [Aliiglaciecola lipolytica E3]